jgi:hypothetical protein
VIAETCSCGAKFKTNEPEPVKLVREWRKQHTCQVAEVNDTPTSGLSDNQLAMGFQPGEIPAKRYDPWDDKVAGE